ncbi:unnamed protein product [Brugia timori]|uniref:Uncharacterized protein n=1 Tax=Brugia timori TaxID=42155 RepID=A0A0R3QUA5_9BILA|nr:unnamed protein product [Brugia timori]
MSSLQLSSIMIRIRNRGEIELIFLFCFKQQNLFNFQLRVLSFSFC